MEGQHVGRHAQSPVLAISGRCSARTLASRATFSSVRWVGGAACRQPWRRAQAWQAISVVTSCHGHVMPESHLTMSHHCTIRRSCSRLTRLAAACWPPSMPSSPGLAAMAMEGCSRLKRQEPLPSTRMPTNHLGLARVVGWQRHFTWAAPLKWQGMTTLSSLGHALGHALGHGPVRPLCSQGVAALGVTLTCRGDRIKVTGYHVHVAASPKASLNRQVSKVAEGAKPQPRILSQDTGNACQPASSRASCSGPSTECPIQPHGCPALGCFYHKRFNKDKTF
jgi:hypothetical protein